MDFRRWLFGKVGPGDASNSGATVQAAQNSRPTDLSRQLKLMISERQIDGLAATASKVLREEPDKAPIVCRAAELLARAGRGAEAAKIIYDFLDSAPQSISARLIASVSSSNDQSDLLDRLFESALAGRLSEDSILAVVQSLERRGQVRKAVALARASLERTPDSLELSIILAELLRASNDLHASRKQIEAALERFPENHRIIRLLGMTALRMGDVITAEKHLRHAVVLHPADVRPHLDLARCILLQKRFADSAQMLRDASHKFPDRADVHALLGHVLRWCGEHAEALQHLERAVELAPNNSLAMVEIAQIKEEVGEFEPALELHRRAAESRGDASFNATIRCHALLAAGRGRDAWAANMNRVELNALRAMPGARVWNGESLAGKSIIVINEGGTGDQIRDACTFADLIAAAGRVTIACEPRLRPLFQRSFPQARFLPVKHENRIAEYERMLSKLIDEPTLAEMRRHDFCVLSPDLIYHFRGDDQAWENAQAYLVPDAELIDRWIKRVNALGDGFKIGISWRSGALLYNRECFYTRLSEWEPILTLPDVQFFNVQYDESEQEVRAAEDAFGIRIHSWDDLNLKDDFDGVAALLKQLDLILAPNTTVLELAGALGVAGRYMIRVPIAYDHWRRKQADGQDRLYPSVRQIRGDRPWDSASLIRNTAADIRRTMEVKRTPA